jgi:phosphatidylglycerol lysyltransferase
MDFLFARLMEWGRSQGYACFSMGMAPLTGDATQSGSKHWPRIVRLIRRYGERYYGFNGLRRYKQKWQPQWQPRYLVVPRRRDLLPALMECAITIAGGKRALLGAGRGQTEG